MNHGAAGGPKPPTGGGAGFYEARSDDFSRFKEEFRAVQLGTVIPLAAWLNDQPWNLIWVRWFLFYALFPIAVGFFFGREGVALGDAAWAFGLYFAGVWLTVINLTLRPEKIRYALLAQI